MKRILVAFIATLGALVSPAVLAQGYFGLGLGGTNINVDCSGASSCDKSGTGGKLLMGYRFAPNLGAELTYVDFGKAEVSGPGAAAGSIKASAWGIGLAYVDEVAPNWIAGGRLGVARTKSKVSGTVGAFTAADSKASAQPTLGVMLGYVVSPHLSFDVVLDFSRARIGGTSSNVRLLSAGLTYGF